MTHPGPPALLQPLFPTPYWSFPAWKLVGLLISSFVRRSLHHTARMLRHSLRAPHPRSSPNFDEFHAINPFHEGPTHSSTTAS